MPVLCVAEPRLSFFSDVEPCRTSVMHGAWRHVCAAATHARLSVQTAATTKPAEEQPPSLWWRSFSSSRWLLLTLVSVSLQDQTRTPLPLSVERPALY